MLCTQFQKQQIANTALKRTQLIQTFSYCHTPHLSTALWSTHMILDRKVENGFV